MVFLSCGLGVARYEFSDRVLSLGRSALLTFVESKVSVEGVVVRDPDVRATQTFLTVSVRVVTSPDFQEGKKQDIASSPRILVSVPPYSRISYGDVIRTEGVLKKPAAFSSGTDREFDYGEYLAKDRITYTLRGEPTEILASNEGNTVTAGLLYIKHFFLTSSERVLPEPDAGLLGGIIWGEKHGVPENLTENFRNSGLIHIIVLSGYNMTIVALFMMWLFGRFPPRMKFSLGIGSIAAFAIAAGGGATVFRAATMAILALIAKGTGRPYAVPVSLSVAAFLMLLWNPRVLVHDPSFQLSFIATLGLIYIAPLVERHAQFLPREFGIREISAATIGTQIAVLPLLLFMMGTLSLVSLPANLIALPLIPAVMFSGTLSAVLGSIGYVFALPFIFVAHALLSLIIGIATVFGSLPLAAIPIPAFSPVVLFLVYGALILFVAQSTARFPKKSV